MRFPLCRLNIYSYARAERIGTGRFTPTDVFMLYQEKYSGTRHFNCYVQKINTKKRNYADFFFNFEFGAGWGG